MKLKEMAEEYAAHGEPIPSIGSTQEWESVGNREAFEWQRDAYLAGAQAILDKVRPVLEFYADRKNWALTGSLGPIREYAQIKSWGDGLSDRGDFKERNTGKLDPEEFLTIRCCGEKAREALKKIRGEL